MMIIDAHTHIFPENQAAAILSSMAKKYNVKIYGNATAADLNDQMDANGISYAVIHMVAPVPSAVTETNRWLIKLKHERFIKSGTLHPRMKNIDDETRRLADNNIRVVKFQPDVQTFTPDEKELTYPMYEKLARYGITVMFHVGGEPLPGPHSRSHPFMIRTIALDFPELNIIAAHLGGLNMWEQVCEQLVGISNVFMESSLSYTSIKPEIGRSIILKHGCSKIFFGTDYPFAPIRQSLNIARSITFLSPLERDAILGINAYRFFVGGEIPDTNRIASCSRDPGMHAHD